MKDHNRLEMFSLFPNTLNGSWPQGIGTANEVRLMKFALLKAKDFKTCWEQRFYSFDLYSSRRWDPTSTLLVPRKLILTLHPKRSSTRGLFNHSTAQLWPNRCVRCATRTIWYSYYLFNWRIFVLCILCA